MKITTMGWLKEQEIFRWGEGSGAVVVKNRLVEQLGPLGGHIGYQHDIGKR